MSRPETPDTAPLPIVPSAEDETARDVEERSAQPAGWTSAMRTLDAGLVVGPRAYTSREVAQRLGVSMASARKIWRALGYPTSPEGHKAFTEADIEAFESVLTLVRSGTLNEDTAISLARSIGQMTDRMVVWQIEALVEDKIASEDLTDPEARRAVVDMLPDMVGPLEKDMRIVYRRQLNRAVHAAAEAAGIDKRISPHSLRHAYVTNALDAGVPLRDVQYGARHADPRTTRRYDRSRHNLDRSPNYLLAAALSSTDADASPKDAGSGDAIR